MVDVFERWLCFERVILSIRIDILFMLYFSISSSIGAISRVGDLLFAIL